MAISQILFIGAIKMTQNTGVVTMLVFVGVIVGYIISVFRYNEQVNIICVIGAGLIVYGLKKILIKDKR